MLTIDIFIATYLLHRTMLYFFLITKSVINTLDIQVYKESGNGDKYTSIADIASGNFSVLSRDLVSAGCNILYDYILNGLTSFRREEKWHGQSFSDVNQKVVGSYRSVYV